MKKVQTVMVAILALMLASCERHATMGSGEKVALTVLLGNTDFASSDPAAAENDLKQLRPEGDGADGSALERVIVPIGTDEKYYLSATLRLDPDQPETLRAALNDNQLVKLAAFDADTDAQVGDEVEYYYSEAANGLVPVDAETVLAVPVPHTYYIVAYSYNSTTASPETSDIDPVNDLLWGASEPKEITLTDRSVTINMAHLFSQLKLNISSENVDRDIQGILDVTVEGRKQVDLALNTGEITPGEDLGPLETPIIDPAVHSKTKVSDYHVFYPSPTKVTIGTLMITNRLFHNLEATFTKTLKPGKSYILAVDLILVGWAYSNIYLVSTGTNTGYLTFDKYPKETSLENTKGVLFRGGSLIGIEGSRNTSGQNSTYALIIPDKNPGSGVWDLTKLSSTVHDLWPRAGKSFHNIPFWYQNVLGGDGTYYTNPDFENYKGDICSYITNGSWRLPTKAEFNNGSYGAFGATLNGSGTKGVKFTTDRTVFFPAAGYVTVGSGEDGGGKGIGDGAIGVYWSGNVVDNLIETYGLYFSSDGVAHGTALHNMYAGSVRCIKD